MGLRYLSSDSSGMKSNLKKTLQQGNQAIADLKSGSEHLVSAIDGRILSGAAYTAGKGLFTDLIIPAIGNVSKALENVQTDLTKYESQEAIVSGESLLDEDRLNAERKIKSMMRDSAKQRSENYKQTAKAVEKIPILELGAGMFNDMSKQMDSVAKSYQDEITKIDKKLTKLHKFSTGIQGLFQNSLQELESAMKSVTSLNSAIVNGNTGSYKIPKHKKEYSFNFKDGALDVKTKDSDYFNGNAKIAISSLTNKVGWGKNFVGIKSENSTTGLGLGGEMHYKNMYAKASGEASKVVVNIDSYITKNEIKIGGTAKAIGYAGKFTLGGNINKYWGASVEAGYGAQASIGEVYDFKKVNTINSNFSWYTNEKTFNISWLVGFKGTVKYPVIVWNY